MLHRSDVYYGGVGSTLGAIMSANTHDFHAEGEEDLLAWMSMRADEVEYAQAACDEFYQRHLNYTYAVVRRALRDLIGDAPVEDVVNETFGRVFEKAGTYQPCGASDADGKRRNVLAWLGKIAQNLCVDHLRDKNTHLQLVDDWEPVEARVVVPDRGRPLSAEAVLAGEAMESLTERERTVVLATTQFLVVEAEHRRLPNGFAEELARTFQTTPENIRQIRKRAFAKIRKHVEDARVRVPARSET